MSICLDMEQFVRWPASVYNKVVTMQSISKQGLSKYPAQLIPTCQISLLQKETAEVNYQKLLIVG